MKILLILVTGKTFRKAIEQGRCHRSYAATTLIHLAALVPEALQADIEILDLMTTPLPDSLDADIVGISTWTCGAPEAYRIADRARENHTFVVLGGAHPTQMPEEAAAHADTVVIGPGENSWPKLLRDYKSGCVKQFYSDYSDPFSSTLPRLNRNLFDKNKYYITGTLEATRGCPNRCDFCVVPPNFKNHIWQRDIAEVVAEIEHMEKQVLFLDSSITEFKSYADKLWHEMVPLHKTWYSTATVRFAEDETAIKTAAKSGCKGVLIGFESVNQPALDLCGKSFNRTRHYNEMVNRLHDHGIMVLGCFVFGYDSDSPDVFERTVEMADQTGMDLLRYAILTPFPGTPLFKKLKTDHRILTEDWALYDTENAVFQPARMSPEQLEAGWQWAYRQTYRYRSIFKRLARMDSSFLLSLPANILFRKIVREFRT